MSILYPYSVGKVRKIFRFEAVFHDLASACTKLTLAEAVLADWPSADDLEFLGLTLKDVDTFYAIFNPIAAYLNLRYEWQRAGNQVTFRFSR